MSLITFLEQLFPFLFKAAKKEWDKLPEDVKQSMIHGSGVIDILNKQLGKLPGETRALIIKTLPDLDEATLEAGLYRLANLFNLTSKAKDLDDTILTVQTYLSIQKGTAWEGISQSLANIFAIIIAPEGTLFAKISMLMEFVYRKFIKK